MTVYSKPVPRSTWGQNASAADLQDPGNTYAAAGWQIGVKPPRQYFNWALNYVFQGVRYTCQQGIATWDATETYPVAAVTVNGVDGAIYRCINPNAQGQRPDGSLFSSWDIPLVNNAPASDSSNRIANTSWVNHFALPIGSSFTAIVGQIQNSQVPVGAVTQWQGSLSIGGSQVTSAVQKANQLLMQSTGGTYATFNWSGQSGQPSWLFGSNDGANVLVWNPANFNVANANTVAGLSVTSAASGNTVMARDANGYAYAQYLNQASANNEVNAINQVMVTNGTDNFLRKASFGAFVQGMINAGFLSAANFPASLAQTGYQKLPSGFLIQWGQVSKSNAGTAQDASVTFPTTFPTGVAQVFVSSNRSVAANGQALNGSGFSSNYSTSGCTIVIDDGPGGVATGRWFAIGW
jgi:hypothetical protein